MFIYTISDIINLSIFGLCILFLLYFNGKQIVKEFRCKHDKGVHETGTCDVICKSCGKNLGFIWDLERKNKG